MYILVIFPNLSLFSSGPGSLAEVEAMWGLALSCSHFPSPVAKAPLWEFPSWWLYSLAARWVQSKPPPWALAPHLCWAPPGLTWVIAVASSLASLLLPPSSSLVSTQRNPPGIEVTSVTLLLGVSMCHSVELTDGSKDNQPTGLLLATCWWGPLPSPPSSTPNYFFSAHVPYFGIRSHYSLCVWSQRKGPSSPGPCLPFLLHSVICQGIVILPHGYPLHCLHPPRPPRPQLPH